jgi:hypothetical protein
MLAISAPLRRRVFSGRLTGAACLLALAVTVPTVASAQGGLYSTVAGSGLRPNGSCCDAGFAGDGGPATAAKLSEAYGVAVDSAGNIYIADTANHRVRKVTKATGLIDTIAGNGTPGFSGDNGQATSARLNFPLSVAVDAAGNVYISDQSNDRIRKVTPAGIITTFAGSGPGNFDGDAPKAATSAKLSHPFGLSFDAAGNLFIADVGNHRIRKVSPGGIISTVAGSGGPSGGTGGGNGGFAGDGGPATSALLQNPTFAVVDGAGNVYIADELNERVRKVTPGGIISTIAGTGTAGYNGDNRSAVGAQLDRPSGVAVDLAGNVYIADYMNFVIRKITVSTGQISKFAGIVNESGYSEDGVPAASAHLTDPVGLTIDAEGNVFIMDQAAFRVRKVSAAAATSAPSVTTHPANQQVVSGSTASFSVAATGSPTPTVQWQFSSNGGASWTTIAGATGSTYAFTAVAGNNGQRFRAIFTNSAGSATTSAATLTIRERGSVPSDIDGDGLGDLVVWRPGSGMWFSLTSSSGYNSFSTHQWGNQGLGDIPLMGDMDGDGIGDLIVWRASTGTWFWLTSSTGYAGQGSSQWGNQSAGDRPMVADMDGDGRGDLVVWRASTGTWYWLTSSSGYNPAASGAKQWGSVSSGDVPKLGDVDGDGLADLIIWRAPTGTWFWLTSSTGYNYATAGAKQWGNQGNGDVPMVGDLDGDGLSDLIVWRAPSGTWFWLTSSTGYNYASSGVKQWGNQAAGDMPFLTDFDGDGVADLTVWRVPTGTWFWLTSSSGYNSAAPGTRQWGSQGQGDVPMVR